METTSTERQSRTNKAGDERRAQIISCSVDALCELGFAGATIGEIARRAGVSKGVVTYHFHDKEALLVAVVSDLYSTVGGLIGDRIDSAESSAQALRGYLEANLEYIREQPRRVRAAMEVIANIRPGIDDPNPIDPVTDHLASLLRSGQDSGEFGDFDAQSMAIIIRASIDAAARSVVSIPDFDFTAYQHQLISLALDSTRR